MWIPWPPFRASERQKEALGICLPFLCRLRSASSRTRFASPQRVFAQGKSPLMDCLAQMSVLYEDLRIETFALTANDEDVKRLDHLDKTLSGPLFPAPLNSHPS